MLLSVTNETLLNLRISYITCELYQHYVRHAFAFAVAVAVMSVDLGSEWMKMAIVKPGVPMEIVLNK